MAISAYGLSLIIFAIYALPSADLRGSIPF
nr:MAG TPA: hypothetical protein [Bacteriophage sp.]DAH14077.1 MAG TPA: hypothetical protein [Caudoviricetes sp.]DAJ58780.1 MAG TPA: hypothetical protein [Caudoviricetes sp.]